MHETGASLTPAPPSLVPALARPVFLDVTGRRRRWLRRAGLATGLAALAYLLTLASVLPGPPALTPVRVQPLLTAPMPAGGGRPTVGVTTTVASAAQVGERLGADRP